MTTPTDPTTLRTALEALVRMNDRMRGDGPPIYEAEANDILAAARAALATPAPTADEARCAFVGCGGVRDDVYHEPCLPGGVFHDHKACHPFQPDPTPVPPTPPATEERDKHRGHDIRAGYGQMVCHTCYPAPTPAPSTPPATEPVAALAALTSHEPLGPDWEWCHGDDYGQEMLRRDEVEAALTAARAEVDVERYIPGYRVTFAEFDRACQYLRDKGGWSGLVPMDEAIKAMAEPDAEPRKLTDGDVVAMRQRYAEGERLADLSRAYGVAISHVFNVVNRKVWRHVA